MLHYLSEDPWPLVGLLGLVALALLAALWITRQGKYLIWAGGTLSLALLVLLVEQLWVTDDERIEWVVYDLARAVQASDADRVVAHLAPEATVSLGDDPLGRRLGAFTHLLTVHGIRETLRNTQFDYVRIRKLTVHAGRLSRQGTAEFQSQAVGTANTTYADARFAWTGNWSLGFRETSPHEWKVTRITPINPPREFQRPFGIPSY